MYRWREFVAGTGMEQENLSSRYRPVEMGERCPLVAKREKPTGTRPMWGRVPMRGTGADWPVVAVKVR